MKFYDLELGFYPRRVSIYLAEKGITDIERVAFDPMDWPAPELSQLTPMCTVPVFETGSGQRIRTSIAILEYLEELYPSPDMIGATPEQRARTREMTSIVDEATISFANWVRNCSPMYAGKVKRSREAGVLAAEDYRRLGFLDVLLGETSGPFASGEAVTIVDCVMMATLEYAQIACSVPIPKDCVRLLRWHDAFATRPSAAPPAYPESLLELWRDLPAHRAPPSH